MAHMMKIKASGAAALVDHYERNREGTLLRENIDANRTPMNYNLKPCDVHGSVREAMEKHAEKAGRAVRSDANVLFDWVVTLPKDCPSDDARVFFTATLEFIGKRYGEGNVLGGYVHMDETTPHMHVPVLPVIGGKLQASKMVGRADLNTFHGDLSKHVDRALGYHVSVELDEEKHVEKAMSKLDQDELRLAAKRLESLQRETAETERDIGRLEREIAAAEAAPTRQETLGESRSRAKAIERGNEQARGRIEELKTVIGSLRERFDAATERLSTVLSEFAERRRVLVADAPAKAAKLLEQHGIRPMKSFMTDRAPKVRRESPDDTIRSVQASARALNQQRNGARIRPKRGGMER